VKEREQEKGVPFSSLLIEPTWRTFKLREQQLVIKLIM